MVYTHKNPDDADIAPHKPQVWENRAKAARVGYCVGLKVMSIQPRSWSMFTTIEGLGWRGAAFLETQVTGGAVIVLSQ